MLSAKVASLAIESMSLLEFFPQERAWPAIACLIHDLCSTDEQVRWLAKRVVTLYNEWPGPVEVRAVFCSKYTPRDGIDGYSAIYLDGIPPEKSMLCSPIPELAEPKEIRQITGAEKAK